MRQQVTIFILFFSTLFSFAQPKGYSPVSEKEKSTFVAQLSTSLTRVKSISCQFTEEKKSTMLAQVTISQGVMYYQKPNSIRWEYNGKNTLQFVLNGNNASVKKDGKVVTANNKMIKEMGKIITNLISGASLTNEKEFAAQFFTNNKEIWVVLTPKNGQLKQMYSKIELQIAENQEVAKQIIMHEPNGDCTKTTFENCKINQPLPKNIFQLIE